MRGSNFTFLVKQGVKGVWLNKTMSFASFCILMVSLLLVGMAYLLTKNIDIIIGNIEDKNEVVVFLKQEATEENAADIEAKLRLDDNITSLTFVTKEEALYRLREKMVSYEALLEGLGDDFLPFSFEFRLKDISKTEETVSAIAAMDMVEIINTPDDFAEVLGGIKTTIALVGLAVVIALATVCLVIISNTTRASVFTRRREINIMKFVGATNSFIRIPFFVEGMFVGLLSGVAAWGITWVSYEQLFTLFTHNANMWVTLGVTNLIPFESIKWPVLGGYAVLGTVLGAMGTVISVRKHLKV